MAARRNAAMSPLTEFAKRHALVVGIGLMFLLTWPIDLANSGRLPFKVPFPVYLFLGGFRRRRAEHDRVRRRAKRASSHF